MFLTWSDQSLAEGWSCKEPLGWSRGRGGPWRTPGCCFIRKINNQSTKQSHLDVVCIHQIINQANNQSTNQTITPGCYFYPLNKQPMNQTINQSVKQSHLDILNLVRVVADDTRKLHPPDLIQLEGKERSMSQSCSSWYRKVKNSRYWGLQYFFPRLTFRSAWAVHLGRNRDFNQYE